MTDLDQALQDPYLGRVLNEKYALTKRIGTGGMGAVYEARHLDIDRRLAVKILHPTYASDKETVKRFINEARASGRLGHPNIVEMMDTGRTREGCPYLVMEFLEGKSVGDIIKEEGTLSIPRSAAILAQVASALSAAHQGGIIHRDIKPENIIVFDTDYGESTKLLDFGISKFEGDLSAGTRAGVMLGSPYYMAPEQFLDASTVDARSDVYSLGAVAYEMLTGNVVFHADSLPVLALRISQDLPTPLSHYRTDIPAELSNLVLSMLDKLPDARPESMRDVMAHLRVFVDDVRVKRSMPVPSHQTPSLPLPSIHPPSPHGSVAPPVTRSSLPAGSESPGQSRLPRMPDSVVMEPVQKSLLPWILMGIGGVLMLVVAAAIFAGGGTETTGDDTDTAGDTEAETETETEAVTEAETVTEAVTEAETETETESGAETEGGSEGVTDFVSETAMETGRVRPTAIVRPEGSPMMVTTTTGPMMDDLVWDVIPPSGE